MIVMQDRIDTGPERPRISVVIPHLNQPEFLTRCLASLAAGTRLPYEVIVVDNGSAVLPEEVAVDRNLDADVLGERGHDAPALGRSRGAHAHAGLA